MRYIIDFKKDTTPEQIDAYLTEIECEKLKSWSLGSTTVMVESSATPQDDDLVNSIINDEEEVILPLEYPKTLEINTYYGMLDDPEKAGKDVTFSTSDKKDWWKNYVLGAPDFDSEQITIPRRGATTSVYIMDSGIAHDHSEFESVDIENVWTVTPNDYSDPNGHGTAIASVISGKTCGLSDAMLKIVKIFRSDRGTFVSEFLDAISAIYSSADPNKTSVVNCSWIIPRNSLIEDKLQELLDRNIIIIAAAGNNGAEIGDVTPAAMPGVIAVGSYNQNLEPSDFSNYQGESFISYTGDSVNSGPVNNWAPGEEIWAANKLGDYGYTAGTSMSSAIAAMIVAYKLSYYVDSSGYILPEYSHLKFRVHDFPEESKEDDSLKQKLMPLGYLIIPIASKVDLLDLSDPKFSESNNWMISLPLNFANHHDSTRPALVRERTVGYAFEGEKYMFGGLRGLAISFDKIELAAPLPDFCYITSWGDIVVNYPVKNPENTEHNYDSYELKFFVHEGEIIHEHITEIRILDKNLETDDLLEDEEIQITLANTCSFQQNQCAFGIGGTIPFCTNNCTGASFCCFGLFGKTAESCNCAFN